MLLNSYINSVTHCLSSMCLANTGRQFISRVLVFSFVFHCSAQAAASEFPAAGTYTIDKSGSELRVLVYRAGLLEGFGHNHIISTSDISGRIEIDESLMDSNADLSIQLESLEVDVDAIRLEEGEAFEKEVPQKDKDSTRKNMLGSKLLDAAAFPTIVAKLRTWSGEPPEISVESEFIVRGQSRIVVHPATVRADPDRITVAGSFVVTHGDLGLKPFKAVLGGLRVRDEMEIKFRIVARRY